MRELADLPASPKHVTEVRWSRDVECKDRTGVFVFV